MLTKFNTRAKITTNETTNLPISFKEIDMNKLKMITLLSCVVFILIFANMIQAQYIIEQIEYSIPSIYGMVPEDLEFESQIDEAKYFLNIPEMTLNEYLKNSDAEAEVNKSTIYIDGNNVAVEINSVEEGKTKTVFDYNKGMLYYVILSQKKVLEMSLADLKQIQESTAAAKEKMLQNLSPEAKKQFEAQKQITTGSTKENIKATGKKIRKNGFDCDQYLHESENKLMVVWAAVDNFGISNDMKKLSEKISSVFQPEEEDDEDEWELVPGKIPVEVRTVRFGMMDEMRLEISAITKIEKSRPDIEIFSIPGKNDGFTKSSLKEMMRQLMEMREQEN